MHTGAAKIPEALAHFSAPYAIAAVFKSVRKLRAGQRDSGNVSKWGILFFLAYLPSFLAFLAFFLSFFLFLYTLPSPAGGREGGRGEMYTVEEAPSYIIKRDIEGGEEGRKGREGKGSGRSTGDFSTWRTWMVKCSRMSGEEEKEKERKKKEKW